jgi:hypothetical protein
MGIASYIADPFWVGRRTPSEGADASLIPLLASCRHAIDPAKMAGLCGEKL